jgi:hypothetical protein
VQNQSTRYQPIKKERAGKEPSDIPYHSGIITMVRLKANKIKEPAVAKHKPLALTRSCCSGKQFPVNKNYKKRYFPKADTS